MIQNSPQRRKSIARARNYQQEERKEVNKTYGGRRSPSPNGYANNLKFPMLDSPKKIRNRSPDKKHGSINMGLVFDDDLRKAAAKLFRMEEDFNKNSRKDTLYRNLSPIVQKCL